ncbi:MAG: adenine-specific methyltransferase EcoRI family protein [Methylophilaceae bacterium]
MIKDLKLANSNLTKAKNAKNDEFYTQYHDIEKEITAYYLSKVPDTRLEIFLI